MNSWKRLLGGWLIVPIIIGIGFNPGSLYAADDQDWGKAIHNALGFSPSTKRQGFLLGNSAGIRVSYLSPSESKQFSKSFSKVYGLELYGIFDLKPGDKWAQSRGRFCLEGFIDYLSMKAKDYVPFPNLDTPDWLSDLTSVSLGGSVLYKYQERDFGVYLGGGMAYYLNEFTLPRQGKDYAADFFKDYYSFYGEELVELKFREEIENTIGFHLRAGLEIQLSGNVFLSLSIKKTFVKPAGVTGQVYARTRDKFNNYWEDQYKIKEEIDLSTLASGVGLSLWF